MWGCDVASANQALAKLCDIESLACGKIEGVGIDVRLRGESLQQRFEVDNQDAFGETRQRRKHLEPLRDDVRMRRKEIVGQCFPVRKSLDREFRSAKEPELIRKPVHIARSRCNEYYRAGSAMRCFREIKGHGRPVQLPPADMQLSAIGEQRTVGRLHAVSAGGSAVQSKMAKAK